VFALANARILHIKRRCKIFEFFERTRVCIHENHNNLIADLVDQMNQTLKSSFSSIREFRSCLGNLHETMEMVRSEG
jgi:hypothetical protein